MNPLAPTDFLVSVIVPLYNGSAFVAETLASIEAQSLPAAEIIVVDDGSRDHGLEVVKASQAYNQGWLRILEGPNQGTPFARNRGVRVVQTPYVAFLDQDDLWTPDALDRHRDMWQAMPKVHGTWGRAKLFLEPGRERPSWCRPELVGLEMSCGNLNSLVVRRDLFEQIGMFNEQFMAGSDTEWLGRARHAGLHFQELPHLTLLRRIHGENHSGQVDVVHDDLLKILHSSLRRRREQT